MFLTPTFCHFSIEVEGVSAHHTHFPEGKTEAQKHGEIRRSAHNGERQSGVVQRLLPPHRLRCAGSLTWAQGPTLPRARRRAWEVLRDGGHVVVELGQEAREAEWLVHADDVLQLLWCVGREGDAPLPGDKTMGVMDNPGQDLTNSLRGAEVHLTPLIGQMGKLRPKAYRTRT